jgi:hypothetical protein
MAAPYLPVLATTRIRHADYSLCLFFVLLCAYLIWRYFIAGVIFIVKKRG